MHKKQVLQQKQHPRRGVVLLIAILISSVALAVGVGVYTRTYKELLFSTFWKESQRAFGAADAGLECALYWDTHPAPAPVSCAGSVPNNGGVAWDPSANISTNFEMDVYGSCALISITKPSPSGASTRIESRGQSEGCTSTNPRRVERGLKIDY